MTGNEKAASKYESNIKGYVITSKSIIKIKTILKLDNNQGTNSIHNTISNKNNIIPLT